MLRACAPARVANDLCVLFEQHPRWFDAARDVEQRWGTPIAVQMAFVYQESAFQQRARPPRRRILGVIPAARPSSAFGYAQAQDPAWQDYVQATGRRAARRTVMADALDFIGWYNDISHRRLGIAKDDARNLYLAYHEGHGGFSRGSWRNKPGLQRTADRVAARVQDHQRQLQRCERDLRCRRGVRRGPLCR